MALRIRQSRRVCGGIVTSAPPTTFAVRAIIHIFYHSPLTPFFHTADFNRHYAERAGYWERSTTFLKEESMSSGEITFYDSNTGKPLFYAPKGRSWESFVRESKVHGWPSFRDEEVNWDLVRVLGNGECVSTAGTHLGHNLPDGSGNRYCINLVSVAGNPVD